MPKFTLLRFPAALMYKHWCDELMPRCCWPLCGQPAAAVPAWWATSVRVCVCVCVNQACLQPSNNQPSGDPTTPRLLLFTTVYFLPLPTGGPHCCTGVCTKTTSCREQTWGLFMLKWRKTDDFFFFGFHVKWQKSNQTSLKLHLLESFLPQHCLSVIQHNSIV